MSELADSFALLLGRQPSDKEKQNLYRVRDALKLKATDAVWLLLMALQHYQTLYEQFPDRISAAARDVTKTVRATAEAETKAAQEATKRALTAAVHEAAVKSSARAGGAQLAKWVSVAGSVVCVGLVIVGWTAFARGRENGLAVGENIAKRECAESSWANTAEGQLAYAFAKVGGLGEVARCAGRGMVPRDGWCVVPSGGRPLARWLVPAGSSTRKMGENP